jgi:Uma2 family endonuclease
MALTAQQFENQMPDARLLLSDEPEMESSLHYAQLMLLVSCLEWWWRDRDNFFLGANLTIYFSRQQLKNRDYRGPDLFVVKDTTNEPRPSWVVWEEDGRYPNIIIELLSDSTANQDRTIKKQLYQDRFRTPEYFWFSPDTLEFQGFRLVAGVYELIAVNDRGWRWSEELDLFLGVEAGKLRYFTSTGELVPNFREAVDAEREEAEAERQKVKAERQKTEAERQKAEAERQKAEAERQKAEAERQKAEAERQKAEAERQKAEAAQLQVEQLAAKLRELGVDPDTI